MSNHVQFTVTCYPRVARELVVRFDDDELDAHDQGDENDHGERVELCPFCHGPIDDGSGVTYLDDEDDLIHCGESRCFADGGRVARLIER